MSAWIILGVLEGTFRARDGRGFDNVQVIAIVETADGESPWEALAREAAGSPYITELLRYRERGRWEWIIARSLGSERLAPDIYGERVLESLVGPGA